MKLNIEIARSCTVTESSFVRRLGIALVAALFVVPISAFAEVALAFDGYSCYGCAGVLSFSLGETFSVDHAIKVTALGYLDSGPGEHAVGIFDTNANLLVSTIVTNSVDPVVGFFRYHTLATPYWLDSGTYILAGVSGGEPYTYTLFSTNPPDYVTNTVAATGFRFYDDRFVESSNLVFPVIASLHDIPFAWFGPNFQYDSVPRPPRPDIERDGGGGFFVRFTGTPGVAYRLQRASNLSGPWTASVAQTAPVSGLLEFHDLFPPPGQGFYRTISP